MAYGSFEKYAITSIFLKILLFPAYRSTDFEVHRNWMALTYNLPLSKWYYEDTSQWTLDYPPFFCWMEYLFSLLGQWIDPEMLKITNFNYANNKTIYFQRSTVIITEFLLIYSLRRYIQLSHFSQKKLSKIVAISIILSPGLLIIDHIHFQYNGFLYGLLLLSICYAKNSDKILKSSIIFLILLCFKHLYLYIAPAYFVYVMRVYCLSLDLRRINVKNIIKLGISVFLIIILAFGPFVYYNQLDQIRTRLFPFSRGLTHIYWAPNIWALYSFVDKVLIACKTIFFLRTFCPLTVAGYVSLFPLIFTPFGCFLKYSEISLWLLIFLVPSEIMVPASTKRIFLLNRASSFYISMFIPLLMYTTFFHNLIFRSNENYQYVPLMLISTYCSFGILCSWLGFSLLYLTDLS
ncbi:hypothetical protein PCK2_000727 [Pneumocystis canis]|nr:hypothetical protein PCK2_000727 [Pneumocystis canis]